MPHISHRDSKTEPFFHDFIARWKASGQTVAPFCAAHHVTRATFYSWRNRLTAYSQDATASPPSAPTFAPFCVVPEPMRGMARIGGMTPAPSTDADLAALRAEADSPVP